MVYTPVNAPQNPAYTGLNGGGTFIYDEASMIYDSVSSQYDGNNASFTGANTPSSPTYTIKNAPVNP